MERQNETRQVWVVTRANHISIIKNLLQDHGTLNKTSRILRGGSAVGDLFPRLDRLWVTEDCAAIPTTLFSQKLLESPKEQVNFTAELGLSHNHNAAIQFTITSTSLESSAPLSKGREKTLTTADQINLALREWFDDIPSEAKSQLPRSAFASIVSPSWRYTIYGDLVVLTIRHNPRHGQPCQTKVLRDLLLDELADYKESLGRKICERLNTSHVGLNAPIPRTIAGELPQVNILRAPSGFVCIYGNFGEVGQVPDGEGFKNTYWATARQIGIDQVFAPLHTMFSRGNITEKQRILSFKDLKQPRTHRITAVDLYAGIGYFAFSYAKAGVDLVIGWEINKWSVEGFRRGAVKNKWKARTLQEDQSLPEDKVDWLHEQKLILFNESNDRALSRIHQLRNYIPAITHVNCGYLPTSQLVWEDAVRILDPDLGGYVHAHENVAFKDIERRREELIDMFDQLINSGCNNESERRSVTCPHVEWVKSYAPGVWHCVFDLSVAPRDNSTEVQKPPGIE